MTIDWPLLLLGVGIGIVSLWLAYRTITEEYNAY